MKKQILTALLLSSMMVPSYQAAAAKVPRAGIVDARIKTLPYRDNEVYQLTGHYGYSTVIEFAEGENIETISIGDSESWQIHKPKRGNLLLIKPLEEDARTNMTVVTNERIYSFEMNAYLSSSPRSSDLNYRIRFSYPESQDMALSNLASEHSTKDQNTHNSLPVQIETLNFDYAYAGEEGLRPIRAFDDGKFTYFQFPEHARTPAIFSVDEDGNEALINYSHEGPYIVVESLQKQFTFRDGTLSTCIFNRAYPEISYDAMSPQLISIPPSAVPNLSGPSEKADDLTNTFEIKTEPLDYNP